MVKERQRQLALGRCERERKSRERKNRIWEALAALNGAYYLDGDVEECLKELMEAYDEWLD